MDFTDLKERARDAKLDYSEVESLRRFLNFQREREGEAPVNEDYGHRFCELLSEFYSGVAFEYAGHRVTARVENGVNGSLVERIGFVSREIQHLATTVSLGFESFQVVFRADRVGVIKEDSYYEFFEHDLDLEEIRRDCGDDKDAIDDSLRDQFHEQVCPQMEDPFFDPSGEGCELYFDVGSRVELERMMKLFILTEPDIEAHEDEEVRVYAAADGTDPYLDDHDCYRSERLDELAEIALSENRPVGWSFEYNDGAVNRRSGYSESAECLTWDIGEILEQSSAREKMAARRDLRKWLEARGLDLARFDALAERKSVA